MLIRQTCEIGKNLHMVGPTLTLGTCPTGCSPTGRWPGRPGSARGPFMSVTRRTTLSGPGLTRPAARQAGAGTVINSWRKTEALCARKRNTHGVIGRRRGRADDDSGFDSGMAGAIIARSMFWLSKAVVPDPWLTLRPANKAVHQARGTHHRRSVEKSFKFAERLWCHGQSRLEEDPSGLTCRRHGPSNG